MATCGIAAGARPVLAALEKKISESNIENAEAVMTGCIGVCRLEPVIEIVNPDGTKFTYVNMSAEKALEVLDEHVLNQKVLEKYTMDAAESKSFFGKQVRIAMKNCGIINPEDIEEYIAKDGYKALEKALKEMTPQEVIETVKASKLRGRGGAGFPTGLKWQFARNSVNDQKYVCCNADEGDPGAFMDRSVLEGDPHSLIEAMVIAGYAIGSDQGFVYIRAEYPTAVNRLDKSIKQAKEKGMLGKNIFGTDFNFDLEIRLGAGAFVCGEETALMTSIEGFRGEPRPRPPFPAVKGLWMKPTILNNVETFANVPQILLKGPEWFSGIGNEKSAGTKVFAVGGKIENTGLVEIAMGTTLREVVYEIGGGVPNGKAFKAAQTGGPSGGCIPASLLDVPLDYDNLINIGSMMGSGGLIVMDEDNCMVDIARFFLEFTVEESCGKCPPCRIGTKRMHEILEKIASGEGEMSDIDKLEELAKGIQASSLCGLGQTAPNPILSTLRYFRHEYEAHVKEKRCEAKVCKAMIDFEVDAKTCKACTLCLKACPVGAISGKVKEIHVIDNSKCIKCGACISRCKFGAISKKDKIVAKEAI
ncbi:MAG: NADH-quinone oxidoreductase subunit NuoF [Bacillota bacterium]